MTFQFNFMSDSHFENIITTKEGEDEISSIPLMVEATDDSIPLVVEVTAPSWSDSITDIKTAITWRDKKIIALDDTHDSESDLIPGVYEGLRYLPFVLMFIW